MGTFLSEEVIILMCGLSTVCMEIFDNLDWMILATMHLQGIKCWNYSTVYCLCGCESRATRATCAIVMSNHCTSCALTLLAFIGYEAVNTIIGAHVHVSISKHHAILRVQFYTKYIIVPTRTLSSVYVCIAMKQMDTQWADPY